MKKQSPKRIVDFQSPRDIEAIVLAQACRSNRYICEATGLTDSQVSYTLSKGKKGEGYEKFHTYRSEWDNGTSRLARAFDTQFLPKAREDARRRLPPLFIHPTPETTEGA